MQQSTTVCIKTKVSAGRKTREEKKKEKERINHKRKQIVKTINKNTNPPTTRRLDVKQTEATTRQNKTEAFIVVRRPAARGGVVG